MPSNLHRCIIDSNGNYVDLVLLVKDATGNLKPRCYELKPGETLIEASVPNDKIKPRWVNGSWKEMATPEEIEAAKPEPSPPAPPSEIEQRQMDSEMAIMELAQIAHETQIAIIELAGGKK